MKDYIVRDSSIWQDDSAMAAEQKSDCSLKVGVVRDIVEIKGPDIAYIVEVWIGGKYTPIQCTRATKFGGVYNYEEYTYRGMEPDDSQASDGLFDYKKGDTVLVVYLYGDSREGIIISCINHPARARLFGLDDGVVYESEFNGINKSITKDGEYTTTFKGLQTNINEIESPTTGEVIPAPEYDLEVGSSYYKFDKTGSYTLSDNATEDPQSIKLDKPNGQIIITSGKTILTIDKAAESYTIANKITTFNTEDEFSINTKKTNVISTNEVNVESKAINTTGKVTQKGDVSITGNTDMTGNLDVSGNFSNEGTAAIAGGANALVYDIVLTIGTGNHGAPVISNHTFLKTVKTKAT